MKKESLLYFKVLQDVCLLATAGTSQWEQRQKPGRGIKPSVTYSVDGRDGLRDRRGYSSYQIKGIGKWDQIGSNSSY